MDKLFWHFGQQASWNTRQTAPKDPPATGAHVWFFAKASAHQYENIVSAAELARAHEMLPPAKAREFLIFRACLRFLLARCYIRTSTPQKIRIAISENGKPWLPDEPSLHFNISHSYGALAIAVSQHEVGIDIEKIRPVTDWRELSHDLLAPTDSATIARMAEADRGTAFLRCFTAREAYLKAIGTGFSAPLPAMDFHSSSAGPRTPDGRDYLISPFPPLPDFVGNVCLLNAS